MCRQRRLTFLAHPVYVTFSYDVAITNVLVVVLVISTKTLPFHNRSSVNFAYRFVTIFSTIAARQIFRLSHN